MSEQDEERTIVRGGARIAAGLHPIALVVEPSGKFLYVANWGDHHISAYRIEPSQGSLQPIHGAPFASGKWPHSLAVTPAGRFLYSANGDSNDVSAYRIDAASGALLSRTR